MVNFLTPDYWLPTISPRLCTGEKNKSQLITGSQVNTLILTRVIKCVESTVCPVYNLLALFTSVSRLFSWNFLLHLHTQSTVIISSLSLFSHARIPGSLQRTCDIMIHYIK